MVSHGGGNLIFSSSSGLGPAQAASAASLDGIGELEIPGPDSQH
jgi:hypothetical protein